MKILFVDDETHIINAFKRELHDWAKDKNIDVITSNSGFEALEILKMEKSSVAVVVTDLKMPVMTGSDLILRIKKLYPEIISMMITGNKDPDEMVVSINAGVFSMILKPWDSLELKNELSKAIEVYTLRENNRKYMSIVKEELKWGGELQKELLKRNFMNSDKISFSVLYEPLPDLNCGGDYYDIFYLDENRYIVLIGDVSGHGIKAAFITVILKTIIFSGYISKHLEGKFCTSDFFYWLNNEIYSIARKVPDIIISFLVCFIDLNENKITYSNAGHLPFFLIKNNELNKIHIPGTAMGFKKDMVYDEGEFSIINNDKIVMYTDGLVEIENSSIEKGESLIKETILKFMDCDNYNDVIYKELLKLSGLRNYTDDVTIISVDIHE